MRSARVAEWILSQVLPPDRAASTVGDWMEDTTDRGPVWFWSCVLRTVLWRVWGDFAASPGFMVGLALRGFLYELWLTLGISWLFSVFIMVPGILLAGFFAHELHWHPSWLIHFPTQILGAVIGQTWIGWCDFQTGRWIARRAPGRELTAGIAARLTPMAISFPLGLLAEHFWGTEINRYIASRPANPDSLPTLLPSEIFLLAAILWARHKSLRSVA